MKKVILFSLAALVAGSSLSAQSFSQARQITEERLVQAKEEYAALENRIKNEALPLNKELNNLEEEVLRLRQQAEEARRRRDTRDASLMDLKNNVESLQDNVSFIGNQLRDYTTRFESTIDYSETPLYQEVTRAAREAPENDQLSQGDKFRRQLELIRVAIERAGNVIGGYTYEGEGIVEEDDTVVNGTYALLGPVAYFASQNAAGVTYTQGNQGANTIYSAGLNADALSGIRSLVNEGQGFIPVDGTLNEAREFEAVETTLIEEFKKGGLVMPFILLLLVTAMLVALIKFIQLLGVPRAKEKDLDAILNHLHQGNDEAAMAHAKKIRGPAGDLLEAGVSHAHEDREIVEEVLYEIIINAQPKLERWLAYVAVVAATAPLLGLLGTVTGMIKTFKIITVVGTGDARSLSTGISEALITTKWGLITAIPTLIAHALLSRMAKGVVASLEQTAVGFINGIEEIRSSDEETAA